MSPTLQQVDQVHHDEGVKTDDEHYSHEEKGIVPDTPGVHPLALQIFRILNTCLVGTVEVGELITFEVDYFALFGLTVC